MKTLKHTIARELKQHYQLFALASFCLGLLLVRAKLTQSVYLFFLIWNLFLAYTPLALTSLMMDKINMIEKKIVFYPAFACWLVLLPNAPYILTDFVHLNTVAGIPFWFDALLITSCTICGFLFGLASMKNMHHILTVKFSNRSATLTMAITCCLTGFGVYLGRFLRYNSWDVLHKPIALSADILHSLVAPDTCKTAWGITLGFGVLQFVLFRLYYNFKQ